MVCDEPFFTGRCHCFYDHGDCFHSLEKEHRQCNAGVRGNIFERGRPPQIFQTCLSSLGAWLSHGDWDNLRTCGRHRHPPIPQAVNGCAYERSTGYAVDTLPAPNLPVRRPDPPSTGHHLRLFRNLSAVPVPEAPRASGRLCLKILTATPPTTATAVLLRPPYRAKAAPKHLNPLDRLHLRLLRPDKSAPKAGFASHRDHLRQRSDTTACSAFPLNNTCDRSQSSPTMSIPSCPS